MAQALAVSQESSGNWGSPGVTAMVLRALHLSGLEQAAYSRGLAFLTLEQGREGAWSQKGSSSFHETAMVLTMLGDQDDFRTAVDVERAVEWYQETRYDAPDIPAGLLESSERQWDVAMQRVRGAQAR
jgi:hypothetical protein